MDDVVESWRKQVLDGRDHKSEVDRRGELDSTSFHFTSLRIIGYSDIYDMGGRLLKCGIFFSLHQILLQDNHIRAPYVSFMGFALLSCIMLSAFIKFKFAEKS